MVIEGLKGRGMVTVFDLNSPHHCAKLVAKREPAMFQDTLKRVSMGLTVNRQMGQKLTVNRQKRNIFTVNRQMSEPKLAVKFLGFP